MMWTSFGEFLHNNYPTKQKTNADRIRALSDEELMQSIFDEFPWEDVCRFCQPTMKTDKKCDGHCKNGILKWLQQPAE